MSNLVMHFEIHAGNPTEVMAFYEKVLGWTFTQVGDMEYWLIDTGDGAATDDQPGQGINGALLKRMGESPAVGGPVTGCNFVVGTDEVDEVFARGLEHGGVEALPLEDMPGVGRFGYLLDPDNNIFGVLSPILSDGTNAMEG
ncbi:VOC family protein [Ornithinimicrobium sp. Arc0846-15]|nr:VOC family protein [Ornithinimicrobium laminariae]